MQEYSLPIHKRVSSFRFLRENLPTWKTFCEVRYSTKHKYVSIFSSSSGWSDLTKLNISILRFTVDWNSNRPFLAARTVRSAKHRNKRLASYVWWERSDRCRYLQKLISSIESFLRAVAWISCRLYKRFCWTFSNKAIV